MHDDAYFYAQVDSQVELRWEISDTTVARVVGDRGTGVSVVGERPGTVTVTAWRGDEFGEAVLVVLESYQRDTTATHIGNIGCLYQTEVGDSTAVGFNAFDPYRNVVFGRPTSYALSDSSVVEILPRNHVSIWVRGLRQGTTSLTITVENATACVPVIVGDPPPAYDLCGQTIQPVATVTVSRVNDSRQYPVFDAAPHDAAGNQLWCRVTDWSVSDTTVLRMMDSYGAGGRSMWATVLKAGTATITATSEGQVGSKTLTFEP